MFRVVTGSVSCDSYTRTRRDDHTLSRQISINLDFFVGRDFGTAWVLVARKSGSDSSTVVFLFACCHENNTVNT